MRMNKHHVRREPTAADAEHTISIGDATFSIARLALPATGTEVTLIVGEMTVPGDADGAPVARLIGIGTAVQADGARADEASVRIDYMKLEHEERRSNPVGVAPGTRRSQRRRPSHWGQI